MQDRLGCRSTGCGSQPEGDRARKMGEAGDEQRGGHSGGRAGHKRGLRGWNQGEEFEVRRGVQPGGSGERAGR